MPSPRPSSHLRPLLPVETGLWVWVGAPLIATLLLVPGGAVLSGVVSVLAAFFATNAFRARALPAAAVAAGTSLAAAVAAGLTLPHPAPWVGALGAAALAAGGLLGSLAAGRRTGRAIGSHTRYELGAIVLAALLGAALAVAAGAPWRGAAGLQLVLVTWELVGLWWVRGELGRVLPERALGRGSLLGGALLSWGALVALEPQLAPLPLAYAARAGTAPEFSSMRDARRLGLTEAAWTVGLVAAAVLLVRA